MPYSLVRRYRNRNQFLSVAPLAPVAWMFSLFDNAFQRARRRRSDPVTSCSHWLNLTCERSGFAQVALAMID